MKNVPFFVNIIIIFIVVITTTIRKLCTWRRILIARSKLALICK